MGRGIASDDDQSTRNGEKAMTRDIKPHLDMWIEREFSGHGRALRHPDEPPLEGEPWMSMADAKELTRRAVAEFSAALVSETCETCSKWAPRSQSQLDNRLQMMAAAPDVEPFKCPSCGSTAWAKTEAFIGRTGYWKCCLNTPDPGPWRAGVDDGADPQMVDRMHWIRDNLSYSTPLLTFIKQLQSAVHIDSRTLLGGDIQRCLLSNAAHRLTLLSENIDPAPWRSVRTSIKDAWAVLKGRAVAIYVRGTVYDAVKHG